MQKLLIQIGILILLILGLNFSLCAQYTLSDDDVVVEGGVITSCSYDFGLKNVIIPGTLDGQTVTGIGNWVFQYKGITSVTLPANLETIGSYAFSSNALTEISLPASLISIENNAFTSNNIDGLDLSNCSSLTFIGDYAFNGNDIATLDLSGCTSLLSIGRYAFSSNYSLTSFTLPEVTFNGTVYTLWKDGDGNSYTAGIDEATNFSTSYLVYIEYTLTDDDVVVDEGIITSCSYDFELKNIIMPATLDGQTVTGIGSSVFPSKGITSVSLPANLETIGPSAFGSNTISEISLPASLTSIESYAFNYNNIGELDLSNCTSLASIGNYAFSNNSIEGLNMSNCTSLTSIGEYAFRSNNIVDLDLTNCTSLLSIGSSAFYRNSIATLDLSSCTSLLSIGSSAFNSNYSLTSLALPEVSYNGTVYTLWKDGDGNSYTAGIDEVTNFSTSYLVYIEYTLTDDDVVVDEGVITSCSYDFELKNIIIPGTLDGQTVTGIGSSVFPSKGITSVTLPANLETIGSSAFGSNTLFEISLPASLTSIESYAFNYNSIVELDLSNCTSLASIGAYAFGNNSIEGLNMSNCTSLTSIGEYAFRSNNIVDLDFTNCTSLLSIGNHAFYRNSIATLDLSSCTSLLSIGSYAFNSNYSLTSLALPEVSYNGTVYTLWKDGEGNSYNAGIDEATNFSTSYLVYIVFTLTDDDVVVEEGIITSCSYDFELKNIIIPDTIDGQTVTSIGNSVFQYKGITSVTLPANLETIGSVAFGSNALFEISLPAGLTSIESSAFNYNNIGELDLSPCTTLASIGNYAFSNNNIGGLDLSSCTSLISIGRYAFRYNSLTSFALPDPAIQGYILNYWEDDEGSTYIAGEQVTNLYTGYTANIVQFPVCLFFAEFLEESQTVNLNLTFNIPDRGMEVSNVAFNNNRFNLTETIPLTVAPGDTSFSLSLDLISPEANLHSTSFEISYLLDGQAKTYSDSLFVAIVLEDDSELSIVGKQAIDAYHACLDSNDVAAQNNMGVIFRLLGGYNKAEEIFYEVVSEALESFHGYTGVKMNQGVVESDKEISAEAMEYYSNALGDLTGEESTSVLAPRIYYNQAWEHQQLGDYNESSIKALATIDHDNSNDFLKAKAYVLLGVNDAMLGDTITAIEDFENAIDIDPESCIADMAWENILLLQNLVGSEYVSICQGENYLGWEEPGQYSRKLQSQSGGDSIVYTFLSVNPVYYSTGDTSICEGSSYNGWTTSGQYTEDLATVLGCDSIIVTNLSVNPVFNVTIDTTICGGEIYNGWTSSGQYIENLITAKGCDSVVTTNLFVDPTYDITKDTSICEGSSYNGWTTSGKYTEDLVTVLGCDSIIVTNLSINPVYNVTFDTTICEGESYNGWTSSGQYTDSLVTSSGCDSVITVNLSVSVCTNIELGRTSMFSIYPNPNSGSFTLLFGENISGTLRIEIINLLGEKVYLEELTGNIKEHSIQLDAVTSGLYLITVQAGEMKMQRKIVIM